MWAHDVAMGLDIVHSKNFVHRDLKTPNILYDATTLRAKVADFGLGRSLFERRVKDKSMTKNNGEEINEETKTTWSSQVMTGNAGSILWMAPEVMSNYYGQNAEYGGGVDVYAYGIVLWELVGHKQPWHDISDVLKKEVHSSNLTDSIFTAVKSGIRPRIDKSMLETMQSTEYFDLMRQCWDTEPSKRPEFSKIVKIVSKLLQECQEKERRTQRSSSRKRTKLQRRSLSTPADLSESDDDERDQKDEEEEEKKDTFGRRTRVPSLGFRKENSFDTAGKSSSALTTMNVIEMGEI